MEPNTNKIIIYSPDSDCISLSFLDILLDETLTYGTAYIPKDCFKHTSQLNHRLPAKGAYELLLRASRHFPIEKSSIALSDTKNYYTVTIDEEAPCEQSLLTDCYILSKYKKILLDNGLFDAAVESILFLSDSLGIKEELLSVMSEMIQGGHLFDYYDLGSAPFLIYTGDTVCYQILSRFAKELGDALIRQGQLVEYYDFSTHEIADAAILIGRRFQAVIGIQTYMFSIRMENGVNFLHDYITGPKYNFVFDHPTRFSNHLEQTLDGLTILTPDRNYAAFAEKYYSVRARFLPPGGIICDIDNDTERFFNISFIATYNDISSDILREVHALTRSMRFLINSIWLILRDNPTLTGEDALKRALSFYHIEISDYEFVNLLKELNPYILYIVNYYRCKVLKTFLDANVCVHVFGTSWQHSSLKEHPCFIWHSCDLSTDECLNVWQQSKFSLNVMSWHKDAVTERILNSMLQKSVVITEQNPYICEEFEDGTDIILYDLKHLEKLPDIVCSLQKDSNRRRIIADNGYKKASQKHTWDQRALQLIALAEHDFL